MVKCNNCIPWCFTLSKRYGTTRFVWFGNLDEMFRAMNEQMAQAQGQQNTQAQKIIMVIKDAYLMSLVLI